MLAATLPFLVVGLVGGVTRSLPITGGLLVLLIAVLAVPVLTGHDAGAAGLCDRGGCEAAWVGPLAIGVAFAVTFLAARALRTRLEHTAAP